MPSPLPHGECARTVRKARPQSKGWAAFGWCSYQWHVACKPIQKNLSLQFQSVHRTLIFVAHPISINVFSEALSCSGRKKVFFSLIFVLFHIWFIIILTLLSVELLCHFLSWCAWWLLWKTVYLQVQKDAVGCIFHLANYKSNIYSYKHLHRLTCMLYNFLHREVYSINNM